MYTAKVVINMVHGSPKYVFFRQNIVKMCFLWYIYISKCKFAISEFAK